MWNSVPTSPAFLLISLSKKVKRKAQKQANTDVEVPVIVKQYHHGKGGVDFLDRYLGSCGPTTWTKKMMNFFKSQQLSSF